MKRIKGTSLLRLDRVLSTVGLCSRSQAGRFLQRHGVTLNVPNFDAKLIPKSLVNPSAVLVDGNPLDIRVKHIVAHKPSGYVSSTDPGEHYGVFDLLPNSLSKLNTALKLAGRLDKWVTGLLFFTQDGDLCHRITSPNSRNKCAKVYRVKTRDPFKGDEAEVFGSGKLMLKNEDKPLIPADWRVLSDVERVGEMTLYEGRYHQVRRMLASTGNRCIEIRRERIGPMHLGDLKVGQHRVITEAEASELYDYVGIPLDDRPNTVFDLIESSGSRTRRY